ncbi:MAG: LysM domain-containing protein, partial [Actinomycetota bacterium]|nr:LysM domain-containing protein [Actinomycetota bacterium]
MATGQAHVGAAPSYTLRWGDTLSRVARDVGLPVRALARTNGIADADRVRAGRVLALPPSQQGRSRRAGALPPLPSPRV